LSHESLYIGAASITLELTHYLKYQVNEQLEEFNIHVLITPP